MTDNLALSFVLLIIERMTQNLDASVEMPELMRLKGLARVYAQSAEILGALL